MATVSSISIILLIYIHTIKGAGFFCRLLVRALERSIVQCLTRPYWLGETDGLEDKQDIEEERKEEYRCQRRQQRRTGLRSLQTVIVVELLAVFGPPVFA